MRVFEVGRKHWLLMLCSLALGLVVAFAVGFRFVPDGNGGTQLKARSKTLYETKLQLMIVEPEWAVGRSGGQLYAADPFGRTVGMTATYARLMASDAVRRSIEETAGGFDGATIEAQPVPETPVIELRVSGYDAERVEKIARTAGPAFAAYLKSQQGAHDVPEKERLSVDVLSAPSALVPVKSRTVEVLALAFLSFPVAALGLAFSIENLRRRKLAAVPEATQAQVS